MSRSAHLNVQRRRSHQGTVSSVTADRFRRGRERGRVVELPGPPDRPGTKQTLIRLP